MFPHLSKFKLLCSVVFLAACGGGTGGTGGTGGSGGGAGGGSSNSMELQLVSLTPAENPIPVAPSGTPRPISFTAVVKLASRAGGGTQTITNATLSYKGTVLGQLKQMSSNIFVVDVPDRTKLLDPTLMTKGSDDPKISLTLSFTDELSATKQFESQVGVECAVGPATDHSYFCGGACAGLWTQPVTPNSLSCTGCGLVCNYTAPDATPNSGDCMVYNRFVTGGWAESCGTFVHSPSPGGVYDLSKSCDQICAGYSGHGKPGTCIGHCAATSSGFVGYYGDASGQTYGGVEGIIAGGFATTPDRGITTNCDVVPATYIQGLPASARPTKIRGFSCCCSFD